MRRFALALCIFAGTFAAPRIADACSCIKPPGPVEAARDAGAVFEAKIVSKEGFKKEFPGSDFSQQMTRYTVEVSRVWKGADLAPSGSKVQIETADNSAACGRSYEIGTSYLIYATLDGTNFVDGLCSRTAKSADAADDFAALDAANGDFGSAGEDEGGEDEGNATANPDPEPPVVNPFDHGSQDAGSDPGADPITEPPPAEGSKRGCSLGGENSGAAGLLFVGLLAWRRRRSA